MDKISRRKFLQLGGLFAAGAFGATLTGCSQQSEGNKSASGGANGASSSSSSAAGSDAESGSKVLVAYYSAQGHTKKVAKTIADELGADIFEIVPKEPYSDDDLDWTKDASRVNAEHDDESKRDIPLVKSAPDNLASYDKIILGYPIWWAIAAWPTDHFAIDNDFTGKEIVTFCTSTSSGLGQSTDLLADAAGSGDWQAGMRFSSSASESEVTEWAKTLQ